MILKPGTNQGNKKTVVGNPERRSVLPDHETVDRQSNAGVGGEGVGADVASYWTV